MNAAQLRGRYAPSPTGSLHLGNLRTALLAWLQTRLAGGHFILRIEDLDPPRSRPECIDEIIDDLRWLGLDWDEGPDVGGPHGPYLQSQRNELYEHAFEQLRAQGRLFPCFCSRKDIAQAANAPHDSEHSGIYPGTCRHLDGEAPVREGRSAAWRYRAGPNTIELHDEISGSLLQTLDVDVGDFVVRRADRVFAYQLAVAVDDALMGITDVLRGADLRDSTPRQLELLRALKLPAPRYWHVPLLHDAQGRRLAKRDGAGGLAPLRAQKITAQTVVGRLAASIGLLDRAEPVSTAELLDSLDGAALRTRLIAAAEGPDPHEVIPA